jgi:hypothetical protein
MKSAWQADSTPFVRLAIRVNGKRNEKKEMETKERKYQTRYILLNFTIILLSR